MKDKSKHFSERWMKTNKEVKKYQEEHFKYIETKCLESIENHWKKDDYEETIDNIIEMFYQNNNSNNKELQEMCITNMKDIIVEEIKTLI